VTPSKQAHEHHYGGHIKANRFFHVFLLSIGYMQY
jgi:hypothetical protein